MVFTPQRGKFFLPSYTFSQQDNTYGPLVSKAVLNLIAPVIGRRW